MTVLEHPAWAAFLAECREFLVFGQVQLRRDPGGFELRHVDDVSTPTEALRRLSVEELRRLADFTAAGAFRPLKSAPNLRSGWFVVLADAGEVEAAFRHLYPGAVADWFAARSATPPVTDYRPYTERQTGMYRITTSLNDAQAGRMIRACCGAAVCLKRRLWSVPGLPLDRAEEKSVIPCLEPCALLLEFARKAARLEQEEPLTGSLSVEEAERLKATAEEALASPAPTNGSAREADFNDPNNPRRLRLTLERLQAWRAVTAPEA